MKHLLNFTYSVILLILLATVLFIPVVVSSIWKWNKPNRKILDTLGEVVNMVTGISENKY